MAFRMVSSRFAGNFSKRTSLALKANINNNSWQSSLRYASTVTPDGKTVAPSMVYIAGEEMTHYTMNIVVDQWVKPYFDTSKWEHYDLSCKARDESNDQVLTDAVDAGKRIGAIFKEPTITPNTEQVRIERNGYYG